jgi:hypothetical protein
MIQIPLQPAAAQTLSVVVGQQNTQLNVYTKLGVLYMDVYVDNAAIILGVQCENRNRIVRSAYLGFIGDFVFVDTQGNTDPFYTGLGSRYQLEYLEAADLATLGLAA